MENQSYIEAVCEGEPLEQPSYNQDSETWSLWFEESETSFHPYFQKDLVEVHFESQTEAERAYHHYSQVSEG
mgnify:CR=1 FL=1|jgi:hypothetical protein|tara:strand:- start:188 stop:403 length:216 start_codon:yes stop_codon:yes gene_type:complete